MRLLIIAPRSNLDTQSEILDAIEETSETNILHGVVTVRAAIETIKAWKPEAIHFAGHGDDARLAFEDGNLDAALLADAIRYTGTVRLCLFNSCESVNVALACYMAGASYAIGWQDEVSDREAVAFGFAFWASWKMNRDIAGAFRTGREAVIWGFPGAQAPALLNGRGEAFREQMAEMKAHVDRMTRLVYWLSGLLAGTMLFALLDVFWLHL
jgi:hypothetical protein